MRNAVEAGYVSLFRYHPDEGFTLDRGELNNKFLSFLQGERRYAYLSDSQPEKAKKLQKKAKERAKFNFIAYKRMERTDENK